MAEQQATQQNASNEQAFAIQRLYLKDASFESPAAPEIFKSNWQPELNIDLSTSSNLLENDIHNVVLKVTVTVNVDKKVAFIAEVQYGGVFQISNFEEAVQKQMLGSFCPNILYPYVRTIITNLVMEAGFPNLYLTPVNFDGLYAQELEKQGQTAAPASDKSIN